MKKEPTVLIADDIESMRKMIKLILINNGFNNIVEAANGHQTLNLFKLRHPELVFLDINMPMKNGIDCLREILIENPLTFVVMVSANSTVANVRKCIKAGAKGFIVKPYSTNKVEDILEAFDEYVV